jgi:hypothetical protein
MDYTDIFQETFSFPPDAIGWSAAEECREFDREPTTNDGIIEQGFTDIFYIIDQVGDKWTVFHHPVLRIYAGAHLSSDQPVW